MNSAAPVLPTGTGAGNLSNLLKVTQQKVVETEFRPGNVPPELPALNLHAMLPPKNSWRKCPINMF